MVFFNSRILLNETIFQNKIQYLCWNRSGWYQRNDGCRLLCAIGIIYYSSARSRGLLLNMYISSSNGDRPPFKNNNGALMCSSVSRHISCVLWRQNRALSSSCRVRNRNWLDPQASPVAQRLAQSHHVELWDLLFR